jgi:hypothetical protein
MSLFFILLIPDVVGLLVGCILMATGYKTFGFLLVVPSFFAIWLIFIFKFISFVKQRRSSPGDAGESLLIQHV